MGQAERTSKLELDLSSREQGGVNTLKRSYLEATRSILDEARSFYLAFFLAHPTKLMEQVQVISKKTGEWGIPYPGSQYDLVRIDMKKQDLPSNVENFTISFQKADPRSCVMNFDWEKTRAYVDIAEKK